MSIIENDPTLAGGAVDPTLVGDDGGTPFILEELEEGGDRAVEPQTEAVAAGVAELAISPSLTDDENTRSALEATLAKVSGAEVKGHDRSNEIFRVTRDPETYEVTVDSEITLEDYKRITRPEDWALMEKFAKDIQGRRVVFLNPTMEGGGVAMLRPPLVHMLNQLGVKAHWYVMEPLHDEEGANPFVFTKTMHNISQRRTDPDVRITQEGKDLHQRWGDQNADVLEQQENIRTADIIVYDDPQPTPLKDRLEAVNPNARRVWRNHIDTDGALMNDETTPQGEVAAYVFDEKGMGDVDAMITHPVEQFVHPRYSDITYFGPATTEPHDDLNRELNEAEVSEGFQFINDEIAARNEEFIAEGRYDDVQALMDPNKRRITLVARFDESKGMHHAMEMGYNVRRQMREQGVPESEIPEIVIVGNGSVDDPSGIPMYNEMLRLRREKYADDMSGIIVMRLKHNYAAMNALMYSSDVGIQTSEAEGCETRISDWIEHGKPVQVFNVGGMPGQVIEGKSGYILDYNKPGHDLERGTEQLVELMTDREKYDALVATTKVAAHEFNRREYTTTANVTRFLRIFGRILNDGPKPQSDRVWKVAEMVDIESRRDGQAPAVGALAVAG